jgi:prolyl-tRNA editing enzyme YbaK/EbsC (Cys-tRNA(Pro) deacylase)
MRRVPEDQEIERGVQQVLDALEVTYRVIPCDPEFADTAAFCSRYGIPPEISANTIVVASRKEPRQFCACVVAATTRLDVNGCVRRLMGVNKASFASADDTVAATGMMIGGVTPFGLPGSLPIYVDAPVIELEEIVVGGGSRSCKLRLSPQAFLRLPAVTVVTGLSLR